VSIESATCVAVMTETLMHRDRSALPAALWCLVDRRIPGEMSEEHALAGVEPALLRQ